MCSRSPRAQWVVRPRPRPLTLLPAPHHQRPRNARRRRPPCSPSWPSRPPTRSSRWITTTSTSQPPSSSSRLRRSRRWSRLQRTARRDRPRSSLNISQVGLACLYHTGTAAVDYQNVGSERYLGYTVPGC